MMQVKTEIKSRNYDMKSWKIITLRHNYKIKSRNYDLIDKKIIYFNIIMTNLLNIK